MSNQYRDSSNLNARVELHARFSSNKYGWQHWVFDQLDLPPHARVLELGCGMGELWRENLERIPPGWDITLTDLSPGMLEETQRRLAGQRAFSFDVMDARLTPWRFADASLDAVLANHMLFYVPDKPATLAEIRRVLKPGGHLYATTIGERNLAELSAMIEGLDPALSSLERPKLSFTLENGMEVLSPWFTRVTLRRYEDSLRVTEVEPLVRYILSTATRRDVGLEARVRERVRREMAACGDVLRIRKDAGMFVAE